MTAWRARAALWVVGAALGAASATSRSRSATTVNHGFIAFALIIGGSFIATGLVALARRPENRFGLLLYAVGIAWFVGTLATSDNAYVFSFAQVFSTVYYAVLVHAILAYPRGRLESRAAQVIVAAAYARHARAQPRRDARRHTSDDLTNEPSAPRNVLLVSHHPDFAAGGVERLGGDRRRAPRRRRRDRDPALAGGVGGGPARAGAGPCDERRRRSRRSPCALLVQIASGDTAGTVAFIVSSLAFASVPIGFLVGILRTSLSRSGAVAELIDELSRSHEPGRVRRALRQAVGDPSLELAYWLGDLRVYVDADGRPLDPAERPDRAVTIVERSGKRVAALIHDPALADNAELLETGRRHGRPGARERAASGRPPRPTRRARAVRAPVPRAARERPPDRRQPRPRRPDHVLQPVPGRPGRILPRGADRPPVGRDVQPRRRAFVARVREGSINPHEEMFILTQVRRAARDRLEQHPPARRRRPPDRIDEHRRGRHRAQPRHPPAPAPGAGGAGARRIALDGRRPPARPRAPDARARVLAGHILAARRPTGRRSPSTASS